MNDVNNSKHSTDNATGRAYINLMQTCGQASAIKLRACNGATEKDNAITNGVKVYTQ